MSLLAALSQLHLGEQLCGLRETAEVAEVEGVELRAESAAKDLAGFVGLTEVIVGLGDAVIDPEEVEVARALVARERFDDAPRGQHVLQSFGWTIVRDDEVDRQVVGCEAGAEVPLLAGEANVDGLRTQLVSSVGELLAHVRSLGRAGKREHRVLVVGKRVGMLGRVGRMLGDERDQSANLSLDTTGGADVVNGFFGPHAVEQPADSFYRSGCIESGIHVEPVAVGPVRTVRGGKTGGGSNPLGTGPTPGEVEAVRYVVISPADCLRIISRNTATLRG